MFVYLMRLDLNTSFPLLAITKLRRKSIIHELLWFLQGSINITFLRQNGVRIWDECADGSGGTGTECGYQWPSGSAPSVDDLGNNIDQNGTTHYVDQPLLKNLGGLKTAGTGTGTDFDI